MCPGAFVSPATCPAAVKHRLLWMCHCVNGPPSSGTVSRVVPGSAMNMAATSVFCPFRTWYTRDSGRSGSSTIPSAMYSRLM